MSIALIITSVRPKRVGPQIMDWLRPMLEDAAPAITLSTLDVSSFNLPVFSEPQVPAAVKNLDGFESDVAKAWSKEIAKYDGYLLLANEYNFGMSGATKNAIDYLYHAWIGKPILIVSYGKKGGANASEQLKVVLSGMKLQVVEPRPQLSFAGPDNQEIIKASLGELGNATIQLWNGRRAEILQAFGELVKLIRQS